MPLNKPLLKWFNLHVCVTNFGCYFMEDLYHSDKYTYYEKYSKFRGSVGGLQYTAAIVPRLTDIIASICKKLDNSFKIFPEDNPCVCC